MNKLVLFCLRTFLLITIIFNVGCSEEETTGAVLPSIGIGPITGIPVGQVEGTGFWITVTSDQHTILVNSDDGFGTNCFIDATETSNKLMKCFIDVLEGDLYVYDIKIQYNAPPNLCDHVMLTPAWHWNQSIGRGPSSIVVNVDTSSSNPVVTSCTSRIADGSTVACSANPELIDVLNPEGPKCVYDKSTLVGGKNCCLGIYGQTIINDDGAGGITTNFNLKDWGGDITSCLGGPVKTSWDIFTADGYPATLVLPVKKTANGGTAGLNEELTLKSNASTTRTFFSHYANFYEMTSSPHNHDGYVSATTSDKPYAVDPIDDLDGSLIRSGNDSYTITCLDNAWEIRHQIKAYIREWNTVADFIAYSDSDGVVYNPHKQGVEGTDCDYDGIFGDSCNDLIDFTDILTNVGGTYTTDNLDPDAATIRDSYFPNVVY